MSCKPFSLSVVVPAYNVERYINEAVDSLLVQTEAFHEIIIINDGSTDGTAQHLTRYANHDRIRIVHTANQGLGPARNEGLKYATGDFVYFLDSDDYVLPDFVRSIGTIVRNYSDVDLIFFSGETFFDHDCPAGSVPDARPDEFRRRVGGRYEHGFDAAGALLATGMFSPSACLYVSRRQIWGDSTLQFKPIRFQPIVHEDDEMIARICSRSRVTYVSQEPLYMRRIRHGSIMRTKTTRRNAVGYFKALLSTWQVYQETRTHRHRAILLRQFHAQAWQYLHACQCAELMPPFKELLFLLKHFNHIPMADFLRTVTPPGIRGRIRQGKQLISYR